MSTTEPDGAGGAVAPLITASVRHGYFDGPDARLHHLAFGGSGSPVVCLHGVTGHAWTWAEVASRLTEVASVYALDLRGHGDSQWSEAGAYETDDHVRDLAAWLDAAGLDGVTLVGYSWGALVALSYASRHPGRVTRLVILDVEASFDVSADDVPPGFPREHPTLQDAIAWERGSAPNASSAMVELMAATGTRPGPGGSFVRRHDPYFLDRWPFRTGDHWGELADLTMPTLLVHAGDSFVRREVMESMTEAIPDAVFAEVPHCGHVMPVDNPEGVAAVVVPFVAQGS